MKFPRKKITDNFSYWLFPLALILLSAFLLRVWGIEFGLPHIYHTDEWFEVKRALKLGAGIFDFERVTKGGYFYLLFFEYGVYYAMLKVLGVVTSGDEFLLKFFQDPSPIWLIGRTTSAVIGTLNCFLVYLLGKHTVSKFAGVIAVIFMAVNTLHVESSHYITVDVPLTILLTISFLIINWKPDVKQFKFTSFHYSLLGIFSALAVITKISAAVIIFPVFYFFYQNARADSGTITLSNLIKDKRILYFIALFVLVTLLFNPGIVLQLKKIFYWALTFFYSKETIGEFIPEYPQLLKQASPVKYYFLALFSTKYILLNIIVWLGILLSFQKKYRRSCVFLFFLIPYLFFLSTSKSTEHIYLRYVLPLIPILSIYAGICVDSVKQKLGQNHLSKFVVSVLILVCFYPILSDTMHFDNNLTKPDTRTIAKEWILENISSQSKIIIQGSIVSTSATTVPLDMNSDVFEDIISRYNESSEKNKFYQIKKESLKNKLTYNLILTYNDFQLQEALKNSVGDYLILRSSTIRSFTKDGNKSVNIENFPLVYKLIRWAMSEDFKEIKVFEPSEKVVGPRLVIYKRVSNS